MARKPLTKEQIAVLCSSPYVQSVTSSRVSFTPEFKKVLYDELIRGKTVRATLKEHGIDPEILGTSRLFGIARHLREEAEREDGFADLRTKNKRKPAKGTKEQTLAARVEQLEHELAYTRQELEFVKKIHLADLEARKQWESKHRQK